MKESEKIDKAMELLRTGWTRGDAYRKIDGVDHYCLIGAVTQADVDIYTYVVVVKRAAAKCPDPGVGHAVEFNDEVATDVEDVLDLLREVKQKLIVLEACDANTHMHHRPGFDCGQA